MEEITINDAYLEKLELTVKFPKDASYFDSTGYDNEDEDEDDSSANQMNENKINYQAEMATFLSKETGYTFTTDNISGQKAKFKIDHPDDPKKYLHGNVPPKEFDGHKKLHDFLLKKVEEKLTNELKKGNDPLTIEDKQILEEKLVHEKKVLNDHLSNTVFTKKFKVESTGFSFYLMKQDKLDFVSGTKFNLIINDLKLIKDKDELTLIENFLAYYNLTNMSSTEKKFFKDVEWGYIVKADETKQFALFDFDGIYDNINYMK